MRLSRWSACADDAPVTLHDPLLGTVLGDRFELLSFVASGGMGRVYRATDRQRGSAVAVKVLHGGANRDVARFVREAELLSSVADAGVVRYVSHGLTAPGEPYLVMEWLIGEDLADRLASSETLSVADSLRVVTSAARALSAAHAQGVVHRDVKPSNLFLVGKSLDLVKLVDFGLARRAQDVNLLRPLAAPMGTPGYMAPEQVLGDAVDARADVYGLGAVLFRCLSGRAPFTSPRPLGLYAKVVLETPTLLRELRPDVPPAVESLVARLLAKEPDARPDSALTLLEELEALSAGGEGRVPRAAVGIAEQRVISLLLCAREAPSEEPTLQEEPRPPSASEAATDTTPDEPVMREAAAAHGGVLASLGKSAWTFTFAAATSPQEQATRAAHCALALSQALPHLPMVIATGRVVVSRGARVGDAIERAVSALESARDNGEGGVRVDAATAELLRGRFGTEGTEAWCALGVRPPSLVPERTLLGRPAPCVGREQPLAVMAGALDASFGAPRASALLVVAPAGLGKTSVLREFVRSARLRHPTAEIWWGRGDPIREGSAFGVIGQLALRAAGITDLDAPAVRAAKLVERLAGDLAPVDLERVRQLLGEAAGVPLLGAPETPALRAARGDASIMEDALREAFHDWILGVSSRRPLILALEDLQWVDAASRRLLESAIEAASHRPFFAASTARTGALPPHLDLRAFGEVMLSLPPLSATAAERMVLSTLGPSVETETVRALVQRCAGNPFYLEELLRAVAAGQGTDALPDSVLAMVQNRFASLGTLARRVLRAASTFGATFTRAGVTALLGDDITPAAVERELYDLVAEEVVSEDTSGAPGKEITYRFRHGLLRDAAYASLVEEDRVRAHAGAAAWLEESGETDPALLAEHFALGRITDRALRLFRRAASLAAQRNDLDLAAAHVARARSLGPTGSTKAALDAVEAEALYWRGDLALAATRAAEAAPVLRRGSSEWLGAISVAVAALGQHGRNTEVAEWLREAARVDSPEDSRSVHVVALCRGMTQLFWAHHGGDLADVRARLDTLAGPTAELDAYPRGWLLRVRGESAWLHEDNPQRCSDALRESAEAFAEARAWRSLCLTQMNAASLQGWAGDWNVALESIRRARRDADRLGARFLVRYGGAVEALLCVYAGEASASEVVARSALTELGGSPRLAFICRFILAHRALDAGSLAMAHAELAQLSTLDVVRDLRVAAMALEARLSLAEGNVEAALAQAQAAVDASVVCTDMELMNGLPGLVLAEVHQALGDRARAMEALRPVLLRIRAVERNLPDPQLRERFRTRPLDNDRAQKLADALGLRVDDP